MPETGRPFFFHCEKHQHLGKIVGPRKNPWARHSVSPKNTPRKESLVWGAPRGGPPKKSFHGVPKKKNGKAPFLAKTVLFPRGGFFFPRPKEKTALKSTPPEMAPPGAGVHPNARAPPRGPFFFFVACFAPLVCSPPPGPPPPPLGPPPPPPPPPLRPWRCGLSAKNKAWGQPGAEKSPRPPDQENPNPRPNTNPIFFFLATPKNSPPFETEKKSVFPGGLSAGPMSPPPRRCLAPPSPARPPPPVL